MFDRILDLADPYIAEAIFTLLVTYFGWAFKSIFKTKQSQESLHSALNTGVDMITDLLAHSASAATGKVDVIADQMISEVVDYTRLSVPDAIKHLKPTTVQLRKMAIAKIRGRLADLGKI